MPAPSGDVPAARIERGIAPEGIDIETEEEIGRQDRFTLVLAHHAIEAMQPGRAEVGVEREPGRVDGVAVGFERGTQNRFAFDVGDEDGKFWARVPPGVVLRLGVPGG